MSKCVFYPLFTGTVHSPLRLVRLRQHTHSDYIYIVFYRDAIVRVVIWQKIWKNKLQLSESSFLPKFPENNFALRFYVLSCSILPYPIPFCSILCYLQRN